MSANSFFKGILSFCLLGFALSSHAQKKAKVFAPNTISVGNVFKGSFTPDGNIFYYFKNVTQGEEDFRIFRSTNTGHGNWSSPEKVLLNGEFSDLYPTIAPNGSAMIFASYRPAPDTMAFPRNAYLWITNKSTSGDWGEPVFLETINRPGHYHSNPAFDRKGNIVFRTDSPDWKTIKTWIAKKEENKFTEPIAYRPIEQWRDWKEGFYLWGGVPGPNDSTVILDVSLIDEETGRRNPSDQYVSYKDADEHWTEPKPLMGEVNKPDVYDTFVFFSPNYKTLYFVRQFGEFYYLSLDTALPSND